MLLELVVEGVTLVTRATHWFITELARFGELINQERLQHLCMVYALPVSQSESKSRIGVAVRPGPVA